MTDGTPSAKKEVVVILNKLKDPQLFPTMIVTSNVTEFTPKVGEPQETLDTLLSVHAVKD